MSKTSFVPLAIALAVACGGEEPAHIAGEWDFGTSFASQDQSVSCVTIGSLLLAQTAGQERITGVRSNSTVTCQGGSANLEDALKIGANVINSKVQGNTVTMEISFCNFEGTIMLDTPTGDLMSGTLECPDGIPTQSGLFTGTWEASR